MPKEHKLVEETEEKSENPINLLTNLNIASVGLVDRGAVGVYGEGQNFFMLKSLDKEDTMAEDTAIDIAEPPVTEKDFFKWVAQGVRGLVKTDEAQPELDVQPDVVDAIEEEVTETVPVEEPETPEVAKRNEPQMLDVFKNELAAIVKQNEVLAKRLEATEKALADERAKSEQTELQKTEQTFVSKAERMPNVATRPVSLGKALHQASRKLDEASYMEIEQALTRAENLLKQSKVWDEFGTTEIAEDGSPLAKAQKIAKDQGISLGQAILQLDLDDQAIVLAESRGGSK